MPTSPEPNLLGYCTNVLPGKNWDEHFSQLKSHFSPLKPNGKAKRLGLGLQLSEETCYELLDNLEKIKEFKQWCGENNFFVFSLNAFPMTNFQNQVIKDKVYFPTWADPRRLEYTKNMARLLVKLLPEDLNEGSISTLPLGPRSLKEDALLMSDCKIHLLELTQFLQNLVRQEGKTIRVGIEPEPFCAIENTEECLSFLVDLEKSQGSWIADYLGLCFDVCHSAVVFEDLDKSLQQIQESSFQIVKAQLSSAWQFQGLIAEEDIDYLSEPNYLHQAFAQRQDEILAFKDLSDIPKSLVGDSSVDMWRVHFHVPLYLEKMERGITTQSVLKSFLLSERVKQMVTHYEIETYTHPVLPDQDRSSQLTSAIAQEISWVREVL